MRRRNMRIEVERFRDGRLKLLVRFTKSANFWVHEDGSFTYVPKKKEVETMGEAPEAIDSYNVAKLLYKYVRPT